MFLFLKFQLIWIGFWNHRKLFRTNFEDSVFQLGQPCKKNGKAKLVYMSVRVEKEGDREKGGECLNFENEGEQQGGGGAECLRMLTFKT